LDILLEILAGYVGAGGAIGLAFVAFGIAQVMPQATLTPGARLILLPGAVALWPLVVIRWLKHRGSR
jgi:hypothetical protein